MVQLRGSEKVKNRMGFSSSCGDRPEGWIAGVVISRARQVALDKEPVDGAGFARPLNNNYSRLGDDIPVQRGSHKHEQSSPPFLETTWNSKVQANVMGVRK